MSSLAPSELSIRLRHISQIAFSNLHILVVALAFLIFLNRFMLYAVVLLFLALDAVNSYCDRAFRITIPVDFFLMLLIFLAYTDRHTVALFLTPWVILSRMFLGKIELRHVYKIPILFILVFLTVALKGLGIVSVGIVIIIVRYFLEYMLQAFALGGFKFDRVLQRIMNTLGGYFFLSAFGGIILAFLT